MAEFKDLFGGHARDYARYRPHYPRELFAEIARLSPARDRCLDVGCGNGQASLSLAEFFGEVWACDPAANQIAGAPSHPKVRFFTAPAESTGVPAGSMDAITAAQAFHWFDHPAFFAEVRRAARPGALLALWCYDLAHVTPEIDEITVGLYRDILGEYWEPERRLVEEGYARVEVPFSGLAFPALRMEQRWALSQWLGYLRTWSSLRRYVEEQGFDPLQPLEAEFSRAWGESEQTVVWPLAVRAFRVDG
ncbi:MAG: Trans-aconitate 2-methyltransferase [Myxococcota bacterium]|nr:Trans-aconitate 2-methyltransferase [Myxococcota bacterium]